MPRCAANLGLDTFCACGRGLETAGLFSRTERNTPPDRAGAQIFSDRAGQRPPPRTNARSIEPGRPRTAFHQQGESAHFFRGKHLKLKSNRGSNMGRAGGKWTVSNSRALGHSAPPPRMRSNARAFNSHQYMGIPFARPEQNGRTSKAMTGNSS